MAGSTESNDDLHEQPVRRAYVLLLLGAPWALVIFGRRVDPRWRWSVR